MPNRTGLTSPQVSGAAEHPASIGYTLATAHEDKTARLWDIRAPHHPRLLRTLTGHSGGVNSVSYSPDGRTLATAGQDTTVRLWKVDDPSQPSLLDRLAPAVRKLDALHYRRRCTTVSLVAWLGHMPQTPAYRLDVITETGHFLWTATLFRTFF
jgi:WD40 repeat protein